MGTRDGLRARLPETDYYIARSLLETLDSKCASNVGLVTDNHQCLLQAANCSDALAIRADTFEHPSVVMRS